LAIERHPAGYDWRARFGDVDLVLRYSDGAAFAARTDDAYWIVVDESPLAARLDPVRGAATIATLVSCTRYDDRLRWQAAIDGYRRRARWAP
jgi:hypothetical protein